jgi:metacaspase-1
MATAKKSATKKLATKKSSANTPTALSLHIGLNFVDPQHYGGWDGELASCEFDAQDMAALASSRGMKASQLITQQATRNAVLAGIRKASSTLGSGDFFMLTFSGHGGQVDDVSGEDEDDKKDETWCLWDSQLIDDELYFELSKFAAGVRVLILSDSCHSGTVARNGPPPPDEMGLRKRMMPRAVAMRTYLQHRKFYDGLQNHIANAAGKAKLSDPDAALAALSVQSGRVQAVVKRFRAAVILISGCQDNQSSYDGDQNGAFTGQLLTTWNNGRFAGNYAKLHAQIVAAMPARQTPNLFLLGQAGAFVDETPFTP